jgi:hypothetical protein
VRRLCDYNFSDGDGSNCLKIAVGNIGLQWYCAEHYDRWMHYYRWWLNEYPNRVNDLPDEAVRELT